ncbi:hypothetical protein FHS90_001423 [Rufibacter quisquiliarum]|uniref:Uncharacterized protein n=1 Tax=Rufibacter quisquiliarum TaxID=1549639 RepID=A0A839GP91_9BACT|nr:hypothetical protein [Rufibacter quisquiliarum]
MNVKTAKEVRGKRNWPDFIKFKNVKLLEYILIYLQVGITQESA